MEPFSSDRIARALAGIEFVRCIEYRSTVSSTNDVARQLGASGAPEATLVIADGQTAGRGRLGREWYSPPGSAIAVSLLLRPRFSPSLAYRLTMLAGLVAAEAVEQVTGLRVGLKWPNDVVIEQEARRKAQDTRGKRQDAPILKLGGILTETSISGQDIEYAVIGLGLNINVDLSTRPDLPQATSLMMHLGHEVDRLEILRAFVERFAARYAIVELDDKLHADWSARLMMLGHRVSAWRGPQSISGLAEGVDESGALLVRADDGILHRVDAADVTLHS